MAMRAEYRSEIFNDDFSKWVRILEWDEKQTIADLFEWKTRWDIFELTMLNRIQTTETTHGGSFKSQSEFNAALNWKKVLSVSFLPDQKIDFWPMLGTFGHSALRVLKRATTTVTRGIRL